MIYHNRFIILLWCIIYRQQVRFMNVAFVTS